MKKGTASGKAEGARYVRVTMTPERLHRAMRSIDWERIRAMSAEIERNALADPDSIVPFLKDSSEFQIVPPMPDVVSMRRRMKLSQAQFALRFGFSVATVRNWEQGRVLADASARILLAVIAREPQAVIRALRPVAPRKPKKASLGQAA